MFARVCSLRTYVDSVFATYVLTYVYKSLCYRALYSVIYVHTYSTYVRRYYVHLNIRMYVYSSMLRIFHLCTIQYMTYVYMHTYVRTYVSPCLCMMYYVRMLFVYIICIDHSCQVTSLRSEKDVLKQQMEKMKGEIESC